MCIMFYAMMSTLFFSRGKGLLQRMVGMQMLIIVLQCIKDLFFMTADMMPDSREWMILTAVDMIAVPPYVFILIELIKPGTLNARTIVAHELPFVVLPAAFVATGLKLFYYVDVFWALLYGVIAAIWALIAIPRYHRLLQQRFSYTENINLNWLRFILVSFFLILALWTADSTMSDLWLEALYMLGSMVVWMFICYFLYRHHSVIDELGEPSVAEKATAPADDNLDRQLRESIVDLFENKRIYLNPQLKLSDVAAMTNSNRTYVSRFFNSSHGKTIFEFVNEYRVNHAKTLLKTTADKLEVVAEQCGFSSRQSFHRVFSRIAGCTPEQYRSSAND